MAYIQTRGHALYAPTHSDTLPYDALALPSPPSHTHTPPLHASSPATPQWDPMEPWTAHTASSSKVVGAFKNHNAWSLGWHRLELSGICYTGGELVLFGGKKDK